MDVYRVSTSGFVKYGSSPEAFAEEQLTLVITEECQGNTYLEFAGRRE